MRTGPKRRTVLLGVAAFGTLGAVGCAPADPLGSAGLDAAGLDAVIAGERALIDAYTVALAEHPDLTARLSAFLDQHRAHADAVTASSAAGAGVPTATPSSTAGAATTTAGAVAALARLERAHADLCARVALPASAPSARLLASISASEATHAVLLGGSS